MAEYAIAGAGTSKTADRLVRLFVTHFDRESFELKTTSVSYDEAPKELPGELSSLGSGAFASLVSEGYVLWVYRAYQPISQTFRWVCQVLRTNKDGILVLVKDWNEAIPEIGKHAPPLLWDERDGYLFWTYSKKIADRVLKEVTPKEGAGLSKGDLLRNGFFPFGGAKYSSLASGASLGGGGATAVLVDLIAAQVPGLPYLEGYDLFDGDTLASAYEGCTKNKLKFEPHGTYVLARRPQIATAYFLELAAFEMRRIMGNASWFMGALAEYSEVVLATVDGKAMPTMQDRLLKACKGFHSSQEEVADALRKFAQQCAENVFQLAKKEARKAAKKLAEEAKKAGEELAREAVEDAKLKARQLVLDEWRKHVGHALGPEMLLGMVKLRQHGIAYNNILVDILHAANPIVDPISIFKSIKDILEGTMAYFDAYVLGMELRECFSGARDLGMPEWFQSYLQQKALMEGKATQVRAQVQSIFRAAKGNKVDHAVDVAMHCDPSQNDGEAGALVARFDIAATEWGIDWWSSALVSLQGLAEDRVKEAIASFEGLAKKIEEGLTTVFHDFAHEFLAGHAGSLSSSVDCSGWIESVSKNLSVFGLSVGVTGKQTVTLDATADLLLVPDGFILKVTCEGKSVSLPIRIAAFDRIDDAASSLLGTLASKAPWARKLITKKAEKELFALIQKALSEKKLATAKAKLVVEVPTFAADFTKTSGVILGVSQGLEQIREVLSTVEELAEKDVLPWVRTGKKVAVAVENVASIVSIVMMGKTDLGLKIKTMGEKVATVSDETEAVLGDLEHGVTMAIGSAHELDKMFGQASEVVSKLERVKGTVVTGTSGSASGSISFTLSGVSPSMVGAGVGFQGFDAKVHLVGDKLDFTKDLKRLTSSIRKELGIVGSIAGVLSVATVPSGDGTLASMSALAAELEEVASREWLEKRAAIA